MPDAGTRSVSIISWIVDIFISCRVISLESFYMRFSWFMSRLRRTNPGSLNWNAFKNRACWHWFVYKVSSLPTCNKHDINSLFDRNKLPRYPDWSLSFITYKSNVVLSSTSLKSIPISGLMAKHFTFNESFPSSFLRWTKMERSKKGR